MELTCFKHARVLAVHLHDALVKRVHDLLDVQLLNDLLAQLSKAPLHAVLHHAQRHICVVGGGEAGEHEAGC